MVKFYKEWTMSNEQKSQLTLNRSLKRVFYTGASALVVYLCLALSGVPVLWALASAAAFYEFLDWLHSRRLPSSLVVFYWAVAFAIVWWYTR